MAPLWFIGGFLLAALRLWGQVEGVSRDEIGAIEAELEKLAARQDSLEVRWGHLEKEARALSARIDSLKTESSDSPGANPADPEELYDALRSSMVLVQHLVETNMSLDAITAQRDSLREHLRVAYDWKIGQLIQSLSRQPDRALLHKLRLYQSAREKLGEKIAPARMRYDEEMVVDASDGPDEIRQKIELLEDIAARLRLEEEQIARRLLRLEQEHHMRARVQFYTAKVRIFEPQSPKGGVLHPGGVAEKKVSVGVVRVQRRSAGRAARPAPESGLLQVAREGEAAPEGEDDEMALEIRKLKAWQQEIRELEAVLQERIDYFRKHLKKLLEAREPGDW